MLKKIIILLFLALISGCVSEETFFQEINSERDYNNLINLMSDKELVLLGESTHGTQEYYEIRSLISKKLIENHDFNFIAVEGDWHDIYKINLYIKGLSDKNNAKEVLKTFNRWPTWMWSNKEIELLAEWLKEYNEKLPLEEKISFYGFDVYGVENSIKVIENELDIKYECLSIFQNDFSLYINYLSINDPCNQEAEEIYLLIKSNPFNLNDKELFYFKQNAFVVKNAEIHYRAMIDNRLSSWNERVLHMHDTINKLHQKKGKGIIWAHNTHVGDARATEMLFSNNINIGQLFREQNKNSFILGFGTYKGEVLAGRYWEADMEKMIIPEANINSYEQILKNKNFDKVIIYLNQNLPYELSTINNNRAIGVVYNPENEAGNYVRTNLKKRYDAFIFIKETNALKLLT